jgi:hypothetical protein
MLKAFPVTKVQVCLTSDKNRRHFTLRLAHVHLQITLTANITMAGCRQATNVDTVATVIMFATALNTPVSTFATELPMFTGRYSPANVPHTSVILLNATQHCAQNTVVSVGRSTNADACTYFLFTTVNNSIKKFIRKIVGQLIYW